MRQKAGLLIWDLSSLFNFKLDTDTRERITEGQLYISLAGNVVVWHNDCTKRRVIGWVVENQRAGTYKRRRAAGRMKGEEVILYLHYIGV